MKAIEAVRYLMGCDPNAEVLCIDTLSTPLEPLEFFTVGDTGGLEQTVVAGTRTQVTALLVSEEISEDPQKDLTADRTDDNICSDRNEKGEGLG